MTTQPNKDNTPSSETVEEVLKKISRNGYWNEALEMLPQENREFVETTSWAGELHYAMRIEIAKHSLRQAIEGMAERISQVRVINHAACSINGKNHGKSCRTQSRLQEAWQAQAKEEINKLFGKE